MPTEPSQALTRRLTQVLHAEDAATLAAGARQAYALAFGVTALLGLLLGLLALWWRPTGGGLTPTGLTAWLATGAALAGLTLWLSGRTFARELAQAGSARARHSALLASAFGLASAPAVPWLLACAALSQPLLALGLAGLAALAFALGWHALGRRAALALA